MTEAAIPEPTPEQAALFARVRRLMLIAGLTTAVAVGAVLIAVGYRLYRSEGSVTAATEVTAALPKGARIVATGGAGRLLFLADGGRDPVTGRNVVSRERARRIAALMMTCGHYDGSGDFAFRVGLPGKSGVGGGILAVAPGKGALAVWSPALNAKGNSLVGSLAMELFVRKTGWSVF